jgi:mRNA interferase MazF
MSRIRVSTTVDEGLLADARRVSGGQPDAVLIDEALRSFLLRHRAAELDAQYVWWCEPPQTSRRPVVVLSRDAAIPRLHRTLIGPCTTTIRGLSSEVVLEPDEDPVPRVSAVNLDSMESVSIGLLVERIGRLSDDRMRQICAALEIAVDCSR